MQQPFGEFALLLIITTVLGAIAVRLRQPGLLQESALCGGGADFLQHHHHRQDGEAPDYIESLPLAGAPWIISALPDYAPNRALLHALREHH